MPTTTYLDSTFAVCAIGDRTDTAGASVTDYTAEESRFAAQILNPGYLEPVNSFAVRQQVSPAMSVRVGSDVAKADYYVVAGTVGGQGNYIVRLDTAAVTVTVPAADASQQRTDEVYLLVRDDTYDASSRSLPQLGYRRGDLGGAAPGPDAAWEAFVLLASVNVPAATSTVTTSLITDSRGPATLKLAVTDHGGLAGLADDDHTQYHNNTRGDVRYYLKSQIDSALAGKASSSHTHAASDITSGVLSSARIPTSLPATSFSGTVSGTSVSMSGGVTSGGTLSGGTLSAGSGDGHIYATSGTIYIGGISTSQAMRHTSASGQTGIEFAGTISAEGGIVMPVPQSLGGGYGSQSAYFKCDNSGPVFRFWWSGSSYQFVRTDTNAIVKTFVIDHPLDEEKFLVHATTESPTNGVEYRGVATVADGKATVELPDYFEALCALDDRQVLVSVVLPDEDTSVPAGEDIEEMVDPAPVTELVDTDGGKVIVTDEGLRPGKAPKKAKVLRVRPGRPAVPEHLTLHNAAASLPRAGRFRIACSGPDGTQVAWLVKATRKDVPALVAEPLRADNDLHGDGPYTYLVPKGAA